MQSVCLNSISSAITKDTLSTTTWKHEPTGPSDSFIITLGVKKKKLCDGSQ